MYIGKLNVGGRWRPKQRQGITASYRWEWCWQLSRLEVDRMWRVLGPTTRVNCSSPRLWWTAEQSQSKLCHQTLRWGRNLSSARRHHWKQSEPPFETVWPQHTVSSGIRKRGLRVHLWWGLCPLHFLAKPGVNYWLVIQVFVVVSVMLFSVN